MPKFVAGLTPSFAFRAGARPFAAVLLAPLMALSVLVAGALLPAGAVNAQAPASQPASEATAATVRKALEEFTRGRYKVEDVRRTPVPGIYEARIGNDLLYVDEKGQYLFWQGDMIEMKTQRNLTQERVEQLQAINFDDLPLNLALKQVVGKGSRRIAVFEDPNCGFCKRMRADLVKLDDITIFTFPMAFLAADSDSKARKALCADDPVKAWNALLLQNKLPNNPGSCDTSIEKVRELTQKLGITGTPVTYFSNGKRLSGYAPPERFNALLAENSKNSAMNSAKN
jgi:thiol:disulfide interchange protein DsbC